MIGSPKIQLWFIAFFITALKLVDYAICIAKTVEMSNQPKELEDVPIPLRVEYTYIGNK